MEYVMMIIRAIVLFAVGLAAFRIMGSQSVGRLTDFDLVVVIAIGAIIGDGLADPKMNVYILITSIVALVVLQILSSLLALKSKRIEKIIMGSPIKLVENGKVLLHGLRRARITKNNLEQELRVKGITNTEQIGQAYMEPNGKLSVIEKNAKQQSN